MSADSMASPAARPRRRLAVVATAVVVLAGVGAVVVERDRIWPAHQPTGGVADNGASTSQATATRRDLTAQQQVSGTLGYAGSYSVLGHAHGTITWLPAVGQVITQGKPLYRVNGEPVVLLYGSVPAYRDLSEGDSGSDVEQLNADLAALGYDTDASSDYFGSRARAAVKAWQDDNDLTVDGVLHQSQVTVLPGAIRVTTVQGVLGGQAGGAVLQATATARQVDVALDATQQSDVKVGDQVTITLPDNSTTPGRVSKVGTVATTPSNGGTSTVDVQITPTDPKATGSLDKAPVQVAIITDSVKNALTVPVTALLSLAGGGYAVEVVRPGGAHQLVAVTVGLFDDADGLVQVTDTALRPGDRIVVAGS
ncbi:MAG TPA: peptidoglycan-binding protein [Pseudonocardiaceae bacterium]|nr:peptidoglycan-binding protein [Pseudonocardiaceae bacterium]